MKLEKMKTPSMKEQVQYSPVKDIVNISKCQLNFSETTVLNKGFHNPMTTKRITIYPSPNRRGRQ